MFTDCGNEYGIIFILDCLYGNLICYHYSKAIDEVGTSNQEDLQNG